MAQFRFSKKGTVLLIIALVLISFGVGYTVWKVTGVPNLAPIDSSAGGVEGCTDCGIKIVYKKEGDDDDYCTKDGGKYLSSCQKAIEKIDYRRENPPPPRLCECESYGNGCGVNCTFPDGTQAVVDAKAGESCSAYIAMCDTAGQIYYDVYDENQKCWGLTDVCKNPVAEGSCACDGGGIVSQTESFTIGDPITVVGWAHDTDGINEAAVAIAVDGIFSGNATTTSGCPSQASSCDPTSANVITWTYTFTSTLSAHAVTAEWEDTTGLTGSSCQAGQTFSLQQVNPNWDMTKIASGICDETDPDNIFIPVSYVVTVTNDSTVTKDITTIVDTLDTDVSESWIDLDSIDPAATVSGSVITWNLTGDLASFEAGESKTFSYTVNIPSDGFGTYINTVIATPEDGSSTFSATETIVAQCEQPITGIFDTIKGRILTGVLLILASLAYVYLDGVEMAVSNTFVGVGKLFGYESKVDRARKKFEKKW